MRPSNFRSSLILGKGEVPSSILGCSTINPMKSHRLYRSELRHAAVGGGRKRALGG